MKENKIVVAQIIGVLVKNDLNAKEVIQILDEAKDIFLDRSWHVNSNKKAD